MKNYPDGSENDLRAPWNQKYFDPVNENAVCFICEDEDVETDENDRCENCFEKEEE